MDLKLCDSDYRFMTIVWEHAPIRSGELVKICSDELGWKKSTTYTIIRKMCEKGFIENRDSVVSVLIQKEICQKAESDYFIERTFSGSFTGFIASFLGGKNLTEDEADELKQLIDSYKKEQS